MNNDPLKTLVLTRRIHEEVIITTPDNTRIIVGIGEMSPKRHGKSQCRIYFQAAENVTINRKEIQDSIDNG